MSTVFHLFVTPVTPLFLGCHSLQAAPHAACDGVTPVTPYVRGRARAHAPARVGVTGVIGGTL